MRRQPGIAGLQRSVQARDHYKSLGQHVQTVKLEHMRSQLAQFKASLEQFAIRHREEIKGSPQFRAQFHTMCTTVGVDPLASNKGMWAKLLGFGNFYSELGVQIVEACLATRSHNGGMLLVHSLHSMVAHRRGAAADPVSLDDLCQAIKKLRVLGSYFSIVRVGQLQMVQSVPWQLNDDGAKILNAAQGSGYGSVAQLEAHLAWPSSRIEDAIQKLIDQGLAMIDDPPNGPRLYWFPCLEANNTQTVS